MTKIFCDQEAILKFIEDFEDLSLAEQRLVDLLEGRTKAIPL